MKPSERITQIFNDLKDRPGLNPNGILLDILAIIYFLDEQEEKKQ